MPTYEYECKTCGHTFDVFQSITASPLRRARCDSCESVRPVRRLISGGGGIIFKGSGFYATDYRSEGYKKAAKADTSASSTPSTDSTKDSGKDAGAKPPKPSEGKKKKGPKASVAAGS